MRNEVGLLIGTNDCSKDFRRKCDAILLNNGGENAVRELADRILKNNKFIRRVKEEGFYETN